MIARFTPFLLKPQNHQNSKESQWKMTTLRGERREPTSGGHKKKARMKKRRHRHQEAENESRHERSRRSQETKRRRRQRRSESSRVRGGGDRTVAFMSLRFEPSPGFGGFLVTRGPDWPHVVSPRVRFSLPALQPVRRRGLAALKLIRRWAEPCARWWGPSWGYVLVGPEISWVGGRGIDRNLRLP